MHDFHAAIPNSRQIRIGATAAGSDLRSDGHVREHHPLPDAKPIQTTAAIQSQAATIQNKGQPLPDSNLTPGVERCRA
ncbi:MAG: hypothetical protein ACKO7W_09055 [Elainella sp.]